MFYCSRGGRSVKCVRPALAMEASKEEQRGVSFLGSWGCWNTWNSSSSYLLCMANTVCLWQVGTSGRRDSAKDAHHYKMFRVRDRPLEPLRLLWLRGFMVWSENTDESHRNKFVLRSDEEVQELVRLWNHQRPTSFYKTGIYRLFSQWDKCINTSGNELAALAQMVACLPLVQRVRGSIPGGVVNFHLKIFNLGARRGEMYIL